MTIADNRADDNPAARTNGSGAAAILSASIGCFALSILAIAADRSPAFRNILAFYKPTGPLSGVTTVAILTWILLWLILDRLWRKQSFAMSRIAIVSLILLGIGLLLTFPPLADLLSF